MLPVSVRFGEAAVSEDAIYLCSSTHLETIYDVPGMPSETSYHLNAESDRIQTWHEVPKAWFYTDAMPESRQTGFRYLVLPGEEGVKTLCHMLKTTTGLGVVPSMDSYWYMVVGEHGTDKDGGQCVTYTLTCFPKQSEKRLDDAYEIKMCVVWRDGRVWVEDHVNDNKVGFKDREALFHVWVKMTSMCLAIVEGCFGTDPRDAAWFRRVYVHKIEHPDGSTMRYFQWERGLSFWDTCRLAIAAKCW